MDSELQKEMLLRQLAVYKKLEGMHAVEIAEMTQPERQRATQMVLDCAEHIRTDAKREKWSGLIDMQRIFMTWHHYHP